MPSDTSSDTDAAAVAECVLLSVHLQARLEHCCCLLLLCSMRVQWSTGVTTAAVAVAAAAEATRTTSNVL